MISFIDKGKDKTLLVLPGWGFTPEFMGLDRLEWNLLVPARPVFDPLPLVSKAMGKYGLDGIYVLGWSLGARIALDSALKAPEIFKGCILVSYGDMFRQDIIREKLRQIEENREKGLRSFYLTIFPDKGAYRAFRKVHEKRCISFWSLEDLKIGLNYLLKPAPTHIPLKNLVFIHGNRDDLCPPERIMEITSLEEPRRILLDCGHIPFTKDEFYEAVNNL